MLYGNTNGIRLYGKGATPVLGLIITVAATFGLLFMCASITKENTEKAVRKHYENWEN